MSPFPKGFERDNIRAMSGYASGEQPESDQVIKLNTNENPYPPSPRIDEALRQISATSLRRYPPPTANRFRDIAASVHGVSRNNIIATRGGDELLRLVITTFVDPGQTIAMTDPTYSLYPVLAQIQDCRILKVPMTTEWMLDPGFVEAANDAGARLTLIVNPHAPTGQLLSVSTLRELASHLAGLLLIDEAYVDFIDPDASYQSIPLIQAFDNVIILRTLSKGYSLAGLRFGYGIAAESLIKPMLEKTRDSYNLDYISQQVAAIALEDAAHAAGTWERVRAERARLVDALRELGFGVLPSQSNFLLVQAVPPLPTAPALYQALKQAGVLVRYFAEPRLLDRLRITVGTPSENERLLTTLKSVIGR